MTKPKDADEGLNPINCPSALTENDWMQIEQAANGCIGGTSDEWPALRHAIAIITGKPFVHRKSAAWLQGFCQGVLIQSGRESAARYQTELSMEPMQYSHESLKPPMQGQI